MSAQDFYHQAKVHPADTFVLEQKDGTFYITEYIDYFYDSLCEYNIQQVAANDFVSNFETYQNIPYREDYYRALDDKGCYWAKVTLKNKLQYDSEWFLILGTGKTLDVYTETDKGSFELKRTGLLVNVPDRDVQTERGNKVKILIPSAKEDFTFYIRLETVPNMYSYFNIALKSPEEWHQFIYQRNLSQGFFQGIIWIMLLYNLSIFISVRDRTYVYYALYLFSLSILFYNYFDFNLHNIFFSYPELPFYTGFAASSLVTVFYFQFLRHFLQTRKFLPKWDKGILFWMAVKVVFMFYGLIIIYTKQTNHFPFEHSEILFGIESIFNFFTLVFIYKKGSLLMKHFTIGTFFLYLGVFLAALSWSNTFVEYGIAGSESGYFIQAGVVLEILSFSMGLGYRIRVNEYEKQNYQEKLILQLRKNESLQAKIKDELESKVKERTREIEEQKTEIISQSEKLREANTEISAQKVAAEDAYIQLKKAQESLVRSEKMASLGQLTAGIAHEINNPINFVSSNVKPLKTDFAEIKELLDCYFKLQLGEDLPAQLKIAHQKKEDLDATYLLEEIESLLNGIEIGANRTKAIVAGLKSFSRLNEDTIKRADIHNGINNTLLLLSNKLRRNVELIKNFDEQIPLIECYPGQLNQVFMNLLDNAIDALNGEGKVTISTNLIHKNSRELVKIAFEDNGKGMPKKVLNHIFEPFFTTKEVGKGSGLGLSITYGIIQQHGGNIIASSEPGKGSCFTIELPVTQQT